MKMILAMLMPARHVSCHRSEVTMDPTVAIDNFYCGPQGKIAELRIEVRHHLITGWATFAPTLTIDCSTSKALVPKVIQLDTTKTIQCFSF